MPVINITTEEQLEEMRSDAKEAPDKDADEVLANYLSPKEAIGTIVKLDGNGLGKTFAEIEYVNVPEERVTLTELFTDTGHKKNRFPASFMIPTLGEEYTVKWIEAKTGNDNSWERVSDIATPGEWRKPHLERDESYHATRLISKTYAHGLQEYGEHKIRIDHEGNLVTYFEEGELTNPDELRKIEQAIETSKDALHGTHVVGQLYVSDEPASDPDTDAKYEIVWWTIEPAFEADNWASIDTGVSPDIHYSLATP